MAELASTVGLVIVPVKIVAEMTCVEWDVKPPHYLLLLIISTITVIALEVETVKYFIQNHNKQCSIQ